MPGVAGRQCAVETSGCIVLRQLAAVQTVVSNLNIDVSVHRLDLNARDLKRKYPYRVAGEKCKWTMRFCVEILSVHMAPTVFDKASSLLHVLFQWPQLLVIVFEFRERKTSAQFTLK